MSRSHTFEFEDAPPPRIPNLGPPLDVLGRRVRLLLLLLLDIVFYGVAYLQLTPPGLPPLSLGINFAELLARFELDVLLETFWFMPLAAVAGILPLACGGVLGVVAQWTRGLWAYAAGTILFIGVRVYLTFEMSRHELAVATQPLLLDILVMSVGVFVQAAACESAVVLAVELRHK